MRTDRIVAALLLTCACALAHAARAPERADDIYRALADADLARADALSSLWLDEEKRDVALAMSVRLDVLQTSALLAKPPGDAFEQRLEAYAKTHSSDASIATRFELYRQIEKGDKTNAAAHATELLASIKRGDKTVAVAELHAIIGCATQRSDDNAIVTAHLAEALTIWHAQHGLRARFHEYQLWMCTAHADSVAGHESAAIEGIDKAAGVAAMAFGEDNALRLTADYQKASELETLGRIHDELDLRENALRRARRHYGDNGVQTAEGEAGLGAVLQQMGDYAQSRTHYEIAEKILAALPDGPTNIRLRVLVNFANVLQEMGDETAALRRYEMAYAMVLTRPGSERTQAIILNNTGNTEFRLQRYPEAEEHFRKALALRETADGKQSPGLAFSLEGIASSALVQRHYADSIAPFERALSLRESVSQKDRPQHVQLMSLRFGLAMAKWGLGDLDGAFALAQNCAERSQNLVAGIAANLPERQSVALREQIPPATALLVTLAAQRGDRASIETAWRSVMHDRGMIARIEARRLAEARATTDPALAGDWQIWRAASAALAETWLKSDASESKIDALRNDAEVAERKFWNRLGSDPASAQEAALSADALARAMPADAVLVAMAEGVMPDPAWPMIAGRTQLPQRWFAFRLNAQGDLKLVDIGRIDAIAAQARAWYAALSTPSSAIADVNRQGAELRQALFGPLQVLDKPRHLFFVPDGELFRVSLGALPVGDKYAVEKGIQVHTLSNESELLAPATTGVGKVLLAGAPAFAANSAPALQRQLCQRAMSEGFPPLPNAARELESLRGVLGRDGGDVQMLVGDAATKQAVIAALPGANIVHLATHGFSLDQTCVNSGETRSMTVALENSASNSDAMSLSGLAFTGASVDRVREPIGVLSADEFASMDLSHAAWVVLSACDSGLGPIGRSEGVFGMRRAIRMAGARTVVMSLWEVDDASTADLMQSLYRARFVEHQDTAAAIASAMTATLTARRASGQSDHPYYWAAFIGEGGWR